jgi:hypothetical protein
MMLDAYDFEVLAVDTGLVGVRPVACRFVPAAGLSRVSFEAVARAVAAFESLVGLPRGVVPGLRYPYPYSFTPVLNDSIETRALFEACLRDAGFGEVVFLGSGVARFAFRVWNLGVAGEAPFVVKYEFSTVYGDANVNEVMCSLQALSARGGAAARVPVLFAWGARWIASEFVGVGCAGEGAGLDGRVEYFLSVSWRDERDAIERALDDVGISARDLHSDNLRRRDASLVLVAVDLGHCRVDEIDEDRLFDWGVGDGEGGVVLTTSGGVPLDR